jgi:hypothetical protein
VCSDHFPDSRGRILRPDEVPSLKLPSLPTRVLVPTPQRTLIRHSQTNCADSNETISSDSETLGLGHITHSDVAINTHLIMADIDSLETKLKEIEKNVTEAECNYSKQAFRVENISDDDNKVKFYTGFSTFAALMVCFNFLGPSVNKLAYRSTYTVAEEKSKKGRTRTLSPLNEFFLLLVRLRLGLLEQDLAYRFGISQSSVSRILITWINFVYLQ